MRKLISSVLVLLALLPMTSGVMADEQADTCTVPTLDAPDASTSEAFLPGSVPADSTLLDGIWMPVHALILSMLENDLSYDSSSDGFVWNTLFYALSLFGQTDDRAQVTDTALLLPSETAQDFFRAIFRDRDSLPPIPHSLSHLITYDAHTDSYCLTLGDPGLTQLELSDPISARDGLVSILGILTGPDAGEPLCTARLILEPNESMFGFSVVHAQIL